MDPSTHAHRSRSFGPAADLYDRIRPRYPEDAIRWILAKVPAGATVVDLGAGTGILSRQVADLGYDVVAVEPDPQMRAKAGAGAVAGTAEEVPLADASVDAVVAGQSYHWFDHGRAHVEIARVLKPGGIFGPLWNDRDESVAWVAALSTIAGERRAGYLRARAAGETLATAGQFGPVEMAVFRQSVAHTPESLVELMHSRSWHLVADPADQATMDAAIRDLCATHPDLAGRVEFALPYETRAYRMRRLP